MGRLQVCLAWLKETEGLNAIWQSRADYLPDYGAITEPIQIPAQIELLQNYPNPFNGKTTIKYHLNHPGNVNLSLYNSCGRLVRKYLCGLQPAGERKISLNLDGMASGVYFLSASSGKGRGAIRKLLLLK